MNKSTRYDVARLNINFSEDFIKREKPTASKITPKTYDKSYETVAVSARGIRNSANSTKMILDPKVILSSSATVVEKLEGTIQQKQGTTSYRDIPVYCNTDKSKRSFKVKPVFVTNKLA